ncbi:hypothetical protein ACSBR2_041520 [Camellia fascicularis]
MSSWSFTTVLYWTSSILYKIDFHIVLCVKFYGICVFLQFLTLAFRLKFCPIGFINSTCMRSLLNYMKHSPSHPFSHSISEKARNGASLLKFYNAVLALDSSALDIDQVENLIKFCPTKEEMTMLKDLP